MNNPFFRHPTLNNPYEWPTRHRELDEQGQPTEKILEARRTPKPITPIPKPKKRKGKANQYEIAFDEGAGLSKEDQRYNLSDIILSVRNQVAQWRSIPNLNDWNVTSMW